MIKHIADLAQTPVLEISLGPAPFFKQGPTTVGSVIITDRITERSFRVSHHKSNIIKTRIKAKDVYEAVKFLFIDGYIPSMDPGLSLYTTVGLNWARYDIIAGDVPWDKEIDRIASRYYIAQTTQRFGLEDIRKTIGSFPSEARRNWSTSQKERAAATLKDLLSTLRMLAKLKNYPSAAQEFVTSLDKLLSHCAGDDLMSLPVLYFRARVETFRHLIKGTQSIKRKNFLNQRSYSSI